MAITVADLAALLEADAGGIAGAGGGVDGNTTAAHGGILLRGIAPIETAGEGEVTFLSNKRYLHFLAETRASAVIVDAATPVERGDIAVLRVKDPYLGFVRALRLFHPPERPMPPGVHASAVVAPSAALGAEVAVGPNASIGEGAALGPRSCIGAGAVIGDGVRIGADCIIHPNVTIIAAARVGDRVIIHSGATIGSDGFGFAPSGSRYEKIPQVGTVVIEDDVEIGANTTVDRATLGATRIRRGVKLDNLIQIAHNVDIGEDTVIASQSGVSGSTTVGAHVLIAGQVGLVGHITVGDGVTVSAQSGVSKSIAGPGAVFRGSPAQDMRQELRLQAAQRRVPQLVETVDRLGATVERLSAALDALEARLRALEAP